MNEIPTDIIYEIIININPYYILHDISLLSKNYQNLVNSYTKVNVNGMEYNIRKFRYYQTIKYIGMYPILFTITDEQYIKLFNILYPISEILVIHKDISLQTPNYKAKTYLLNVMERMLKLQYDDTEIKKFNDKYDYIMRKGSVSDYPISTSTNKELLSKYNRDNLVNTTSTLLSSFYINKGDIANYLLYGGEYSDRIIKSGSGDIVLDAPYPSLLINRYPETISLNKYRKFGYEGNINELENITARLNKNIKKLRRLDDNRIYDVDEDEEGEILISCKNELLNYFNYIVGYMYTKIKDDQLFKYILRRYVKLSDFINNIQKTLFEIDDDSDEENLFILRTLDKDIIKTYFSQLLELHKEVGDIQSIISKASPEILWIILPWINEIIPNNDLYDMISPELSNTKTNMIWLFTYSLSSNNEIIQSIILNMLNDFIIIK
ncbi:F-box domain-containing protein [Orpheovirus IHUMI-LCC2]|uniref:F-box domain-containing protein n=1 Tax=Orpheovirus IHUMI-LCC2 TaxID=2023057 RepID=A0A2I2L467_9VIRU|nr:F-box domain-containing protein [Orpheovirus IHUMI-LCC2]SNW62323.1 F-box domain-containing protein [Orpheovirus IHUMI-LCC2]